MKKLSKAELNNIFLHLNLGEILKVEKQTEGDVNQVCKVSTRDKKFIIRINTKEELDKFKMELECYEKTKPLGIPGPEVLKVTRYEDYSIMILEYVESQPVKPSYVWQKLGEYTKLIAQIGEIKAQDVQNREKWLYKDYIDYNIKAIDDKDFILEDALVRKENYTSLNERFDYLTRQKFKLGLTHGDIAPDNCIYGQDNKLYLIDWSCASIHIVPELEIVNTYIRWKLEDKISKEDMKAFLKGASLEENYLEKNWYKIESLIYLHLIDKLRWAKDNHKKENFKWYKKLLTKFENLAPDERY